MDQPNASPTEEVRALQEAYAALNRNDIAGFVRIFDTHVVRTEFPDSPGGGTYRGLEAVKAHAELQRSKWAEGACEPEKILVAKNGVIVFVRVRVRLKDESGWREGRVADVFRFRDGKVVENRTFVDSQEALEWAGASLADRPTA